MRERIQHIGSFVKSALITAVIHGILLAILFVGQWSFSEQSIKRGTTEPIQAEIVFTDYIQQQKAAETKRLADEKLKREQAQEKKRVADEKKRKQEAETKRLADEKLKREQAQERKRVADEKKRKQEAETKRLADEKLKRKQAQEKKRVADEKKRKQEAETKRLADEKLKREQEQEKKRVADEKKRKQEAETKRLADEKLKREQAQEKKRLDAERLKREQGLKAELEKESILRQRAQTKLDAASALSVLADRIAIAVENNWRRPLNSATGLVVTITVKVSQNGDVLSANVVKSSGDRFFDQSAERAVKKASPLPFPSNSEYYEFIDVFNIKFNPDE